jgi:hypothetical protein
VNPLMVEALGSVLRAALNIGAGWLVAHGIWQQSDAEKYVGALALALLSVGWSLWQHYRMRSKLVTAMAMPVGATEHEVERAVNDPAIKTPPVTLPKYASSSLLSMPDQVKDR